MPVLSGSDQITITNIKDSLTCEVVSSSGTALVDAKKGTTLTCYLYDSNGEVDKINEETGTSEFIYYWNRKFLNGSGKVREDDNFLRIGKIIDLVPEDFINNILDNLNKETFVFSCSVYDAPFGTENANLVGYGEIILDTTIKKWMKFDEKLGLSIQMPGSEWATLTDDKGYHVFHKTDDSDKNIINDDYWSGSFAYGSIFVPKIREGGLQVVNTNNDTQSLSGGWAWKEYEDGDIISPTLHFNSVNEQLDTNQENNSINDSSINGETDDLLALNDAEEILDFPEVAEGGESEIDSNDSSAKENKYFKMKLFVDGKESWYVKKNSVCDVKLYYNKDDINIVEKGYKYIDIVFSFQPYYTLKNNNNNGQGPFVYRVKIDKYKSKDNETACQETGDYYSIDEKNVILYIKGINFTDDGNNIDDVINFAESSCFPAPFALGIKIYDDNMSQVSYGTYHYFEGEKDLGPLHGFYFNNNYLMFIWPTLAYYKFIPLDNERLFNLETAVIPSIRYYIESVARDFNIGEDEGIFLYMNITSKNCIKNENYSPIKIDFDLESNFLNAYNDDYQFPEEEEEGNENEEVYKIYNFEAGSCQIIDAIKRHTTDELVIDTFEEDTKVNTEAGYIITNNIINGEFNYDLELINILNNKNDTPLIYFTIERDLDNGTYQVLYDSRDNMGHFFEIQEYDLNIKETIFYPYKIKENVRYYDKESDNYYLNVRVSNTEKLMPIVGEVRIEPFQKTRLTGIGDSPRQFLNTVWDYYKCDDDEAESIYEGEKTSGFNIDMILENYKLNPEREYYITFYDKTLYQYYNLLSILNMIPEEGQEPLKYSNEFGKIICTTPEDDAYNGMMVDDYDGLFPYDRAMLNPENISAFNIEKSGISIGRDTTGIASNKKFEVSKDYNSYFYGKINFDNEVYFNNIVYFNDIATSEILNYKIGEFLTGKRWINDKPIYRYIQKYTGNQSTGAVNLGKYPVGLEDLVSIRGLVTYSSTQSTFTMPMPFVHSTTSLNNSIFINKTTGMIRAFFGNNTEYAGGKDIIVILEYTKNYTNN